MAKLYFKGSEVAQNQVLSGELLNLIEQGIARTEKQASFRSLYDIEITGIALYYNKKWCYEKIVKAEDEKEMKVAAVSL
jgi:hypothetical protein